MSGAVLAALFFLTSLARMGDGPLSQAVTLRPGSNVQEGSIVSIEYTVSDETGKVVDSNVGKEPLTFVQGAGQIVRGLEQALNGLKIGDRKRVQVKPEDGYGLPNEKGFQEVPRDMIPVDAQKPGTMLLTKTPDGRTVPMRVHEVREKTVVVDFNHPLAGKTLNFDVTIKDIKDAEAK
ncbi:MAG TPA: peptidylprolyl isomerase [Terriglobales bacterium]|nr:peptidylprolyl isomerase [Terriglobales bacterium]